MPERRRVPRTAVCKPARVMLDRNQIIDCTVRNLTSIGACVEISDTEIESMSENVDFSFDNFHTVHIAKIIWRDNTRIGVAFENVAAVSDAFSCRAKLRCQ